MYHMEFKAKIFLGNVHSFFGAHKEDIVKCESALNESAHGQRGSNP